MRVFIWGAGYYCEYVYNSLKSGIEVIGIIDNDEEKENKIWKNNIKIFSPGFVKNTSYDFIIISVTKRIFIEEIKKMCRKLDVPSEKLICYWEDKSEIFENRILRILEEKRRADVFRARLDSAPYEWGIITTPQILSAEECLHKIKEGHCSLCRFGDGEFNIICKKGNPWFQNNDTKLQKRLLEVIVSNNDRILLGIAQNFKNLECLTEEAADIIRIYMEGKTRKDILNLLSVNKIYYDAYVSRPYIIYQDKSRANVIFKMYKQIWKNRSVLIVEGKYGRMGIGNDLFETAKEIRRIVCPPSNAWNYYDEILSAVKKLINDPQILVCISLGPVATVLAYDLGISGIQAIDIGQLDNEYEWYISGAKYRESISGKMVAEIEGHPIPVEHVEEEYYSQIAIKIG